MHPGCFPALLRAEHLARGGPARSQLRRGTMQNADPLAGHRLQAQQHPLEAGALGSAPCLRPCFSLPAPHTRGESRPVIASPWQERV